MVRFLWSLLFPHTPILPEREVERWLREQGLSPYGPE